MGEGKQLLSKTLVTSVDIFVEMGKTEILKALYSDAASTYRKNTDLVEKLAKGIENRSLASDIDDAFNLVIDAATEAAYRQGLFDGLQFQEALLSGQKFINDDSE